MNRWFNKFPLIGKYVPSKIILSFLMFLLAVFLFILIGTMDRVFCVFAMLFSFFGDCALNHRRSTNSKVNRDFLIGGTSFIIAHILYCVAYSIKIANYNFPFFNFGISLAIIILAGITLFFLGKSREKSKLFKFCLLYLWITGIDYAIIFSYSISIKSIESLALIGGLSFLTSDVIIGLEGFMGMRSKRARELVWWLYPIGQILLICFA